MDQLAAQIAVAAFAQAQVPRLAAGPVLGAFLVGTLTRSVGSRAMLIGMLAGIAVVTWVWHTNATAWTWFAFVGAVATSLVAVAASAVVREREPQDAGRVVGS